jgi:hypothetical protein
VSWTGTPPSEELVALKPEPFASQHFDVSGIVPEGWAEAAPGTYLRSTPPADPTSLTQKSYPGMTIDELTAVLWPALGLDELPASMDSRETPAFAWDLYATEVEVPGVGTVMVDLALAETDVATYLVLSQSLADEYDALHEAVFLPAVDALAPVA